MRKKRLDAFYTRTPYAFLTERRQFFFFFPGARLAVYFISRKQRAQRECVMYTPTRASLLGIRSFRGEIFCFLIGLFTSTPSLTRIRVYGLGVLLSYAQMSIMRFFFFVCLRKP